LRWRKHRLLHRQRRFLPGVTKQAGCNARSSWPLCGGKSAVWHNWEIKPGQEWDAAIKQELAEADIILLPVSPHFLASDYIWQHEISKAMERHDRQEATVIPVFLKPCDWRDMPFAKVQGLPRNARPVTQHADQDEAFMDIVQGIRRFFEAK
jgi:hypothetical protein